MRADDDEDHAPAARLEHRLQPWTAGLVVPVFAFVASGEQSGKLGQGLERAAQDLEQELESLVAALVALVEPGVLLVMGGVVLLMVLSILMPIVNLNNLAGL